MTVIRDIFKITIMPVVKTEFPDLQGFYIKAYSRDSIKKPKFLINGIRIVNIEQSNPYTSKYRISWLKGRDAILIEEHDQQDPRKIPSMVAFQVNFNEQGNHHIIRGNPSIEKNSFRNETIEVEWTRSDQSNLSTMTLSNGGNTFSCKIDQKKKKINMQLDKHF